MKALRHDDQRAGLGIVEAADHGRGNPAKDLVTPCFGEGIIRLHRIVDDDEVGPLAGEGAADGGRDAPPPDP